MYDVGNRESFDALDSWLEEIKKDIGSPADFEGVAFAVCANKVRKESLIHIIIWQGSLGVNPGVLISSFLVEILP